MKEDLEKNLHKRLDESAEKYVPIYTHIMEKTRVNKGEKFWFIDYDMAVIGIAENYQPFCNNAFKCGNYFATREEAEAVARKLRAVLKGAEVIEMPSEEEIYKERPKNDGNRYFNEGKNLGWWSCVGFFKSKIVK